MGILQRIARRLGRLLGYRPRQLRGMGSLSPSAVVQRLLRVDGAANIHIGAGAIVQRGSWLAAVPLTGAKQCRLEIGAGAVIGHFNHIYCTRSITIEENVLTADKVYISDCAHSYADVDTPIVRQPVVQLCDVVIGRGAWLGENVCVIGASVGRGSVIGANSVVTKDIPDYCVAVGAPARVIKRYNPDTRQWEKVG